MSDWDVVSQAPAPKVGDHKDFHALMDSTFGKGKWHQTGGYRTPERENELRREGAGTVPPGHLSDHSRGTVENPGAYDVTVDGLNPRQIARRLQETGADFLHYYPEGQRANQGGHLHVAVPLSEPHEAESPHHVQTSAAPDDEWQVASQQPIAKPKPAAPPKRSAMGEIAESFRDVPREVFRQTGEAVRQVGRDLQAKPTGNILEEAKQGGRNILDLVGVVGAPIAGALTSMIGRPVENATHGRIPRRVTGDVASMAIPFAGEAMEASKVARFAREEGVPLNMARQLLEKRRAAATPAEPGRVQRAVTAPARAAVAITKPGAKALVNFVQRVKGTDNIDKVAMDRVLSRIESDAKGGGPTAQDMIDIRTKAQHKPMSMMDVGGANLVSYAGRLARKPGESKNVLESFLKKRDDAAFTRIRADIEKHISKGGPAYASKDALVESRKAAAAPLYEAAYAKYPVNPDVLGPEGQIGKLTARPSYRAGMRNALKIAAEEGVDPNTLGITLDDAGEPRFAKVPTWKTLDYVKRGMDDVVETYRDKTTGKLVLDTYGRAADATRTLYRSTLKQLNPEYGKALDSFSGDSSSIDAVNRGQNIFNTKPEQIRAFLKDMPDSDREFYRLGAADGLLLKLSKTSLGGDEAKKLVGNQYVREQISALFPKQAEADKFIDSVIAEMDMFATKQAVLGGSQTGARVAEDASREENMANHAGKAAVGAASGRWGTAAKNAVEALRYHAERNDPAIDAAAARILSQPLSSQNQIGTMGTNALGALLERHASTLAPQNRNFLLQASRRLQARDYGRTAAHIGGAGAVAGASDLGGNQQ